MKHIFVFRTSVASLTEVARLQDALNTLVEEGGRWNFDLADRENILRVESGVCRPAQVITALARRGYACEELE